VVQQVGIKYYVFNIASWKMYNIKFIIECMSVSNVVFCTRWEMNSYVCLYILYSDTEE